MVIFTFASMNSFKKETQKIVSATGSTPSTPLIASQSTSSRNSKLAKDHAAFVRSFSGEAKSFWWFLGVSFGAWF